MKYYLVLAFMAFKLEAATTLKQSFEAAKLNMETLKRSGHQITQAIERKNQARAALLPTISGVANDTRIDRPDARPGVSSAFILTRQYSAGLRLQQPLLRGGVFSGLQTRNEEILLSEFQKNATEINLYQLVINAYFNLQYAQQDAKNLSQLLLKYSQERVKELRSLAGVGRSRKVELIQAEAQFLAAQTQHRQGEISLNEARENFAFYTGIRTAELAPLEFIPKELGSITEYSEKLNGRPDILARQQEVKVAQRMVEVSKGGHYPNVDLVSNYYFDRTGVLQTSEWGIGVVVTVPIFQGGTVVSRVRESVEAKRIAELNADEANRAARRDLAILYQNYHQLMSQLETMRGALKKSEEAYRLNLKDYRYGQVTNLEVLQSLNMFIETKRSYDSLITQSHQTYKNLEASIGVLP